MDDVTQQNAALVEQASAASQSLQEQAQTLNQLVTRFVLAESGATPVIKPAPASHKAPQPGRLALASDADWQSFQSLCPPRRRAEGLSPTDEFPQARWRERHCFNERQQNCYSVNHANGHHQRRRFTPACPPLP